MSEKAQLQGSFLPIGEDYVDCTTFVVSDVTLNTV
jgi:hypothetical protein